MKRKTAGLAALLSALGLLAGCGNAEVTSRDLNSMRVEKYVTLGDYGGMEVSAALAKVEQAEWDELTLAIYQSHVTAENGGVTDRPVETGDTVNIDYAGEKDGVAFGGGTAQGAQLVIGSGQFIDGFEDGLVGVAPGETVELDLAFPEGYRNQELAGQPVVFTVTVNYIYPGLEEMQDAVVASMGFEEAGTVEELRQYVYDYLKEEAEENYLYDLHDSIMELLMERSEFGELPETFVDSYKNNISTSLESIAAQNGVTADVYTNYFYNMGSQEYVEAVSDMQARQELVLQAVANREGLAVDDEELAAKLEEHAKKQGSTVEKLLEVFDREDYRNYFMCEKVMEFLVENANITE